MAKYKVYISSTYMDLKEVRAQIIQRIQKGLHNYFELVDVMELMGNDGSNKLNIDICLKNVRDADLYILLIGNRYGSSPDNYDKSYTELEYDMACKTLQKKFYKIYKLQFSEDFYRDNNVNGDSDRTKINSFINRLEGRDSPSIIDSYENLAKVIDDKLTEFNLAINKKTELKLIENDKVSIDRKEQLGKLEQREISGASSHAVVFTVYTIGEEDAYDMFTLKLRNKLIANNEQAYINYIDFESSASKLDFDNTEKILNTFLIEASLNIYGERANMISFEKLEERIRNREIKKKIIGFKIEKNSDYLSFTEQFTKAIGVFITKINKILKDANFDFNFYFVIYIIDKETGVSSTLNENNLITDTLKSHIPGIEYYELGKFSPVNNEDIDKWLQDIITTKNIEDEVDDLFNLIFLDRNNFPSSYKKCLSLIDKRTI
ncbi:MAG: hypothetical protein JWN78_1000 [Bacteroidota bacterium]|nr:hypothetical protein [Bacteroidota bacterium]